MKPAKPKSCRVWCVVVKDGTVIAVRKYRGNALKLAYGANRVIPATLQFSTPRKKGK
jgi:hypothetical protein